MTEISKSYDALARSIESGDSISMDSKQWSVDNWLVGSIKRSTLLNESSTIEVCRVASEILDSLESQSIFFNDDAPSGNGEYNPFLGTLKVARAALGAIQKFQSARAKSTADSLEMRIISLKYRLEEVNGGVEKKEEANLATELEELAAKWKRGVDEELPKKWREGMEIFPEDPEDYRKLYDIDKEHLKEACRYPEFVELLLRSPKLQEEFFGWTLKSCIHPAPFIEYYSTAAKLKKINLTARIGYYCSYNPLRIEKQRISPDKGISTLVKVLTLPFSNRRVSILREDRSVAFRGLYPVTIATIFKDFANKNKRVGDFEFFSSGIELWNSEETGYYDPIGKRWVRVDLTKDRWWESNLLPVEEIVEKEDLLQRFRIKDIEKEQWLLLARSTRQSNKYRIDDCHGFSEAYIPLGNGTWRLYSFGKYAKEWPRDPLGALAIVGATVPAFYATSDPNTFYSSFRQQAAFPVVAEKDEGEKYMEETKKTIVAGREGNLDFMFAYRNCSYAPQTILEEVFGIMGEDGGRIPNFFISHVTKADAREPLGAVFRFAARCRKPIRELVVALFERLLLSFRGFFLTNSDGVLEFASLANSLFRRGGKRIIDGKEIDVKHHIYLPSHLFRRIIKKEKELEGGLIWAGNQHFYRKRNISTN